MPSTPLTCCSISSRHSVRHHRGAGPGIVYRHRHAGRRDPRILCHRQRVERDHADQSDHDRQHRREDRSIDEEVRDHGRRTLGQSRAGRRRRMACGSGFGLSASASAGHVPRLAVSGRRRRLARSRPRRSGAIGHARLGRASAWASFRRTCIRGRTCCNAADDDPVVRLQPLFDHPQAVVLERTRRDPAILHLVLGIDHVDELQPLVRRRRPGR